MERSVETLRETGLGKVAPGGELGSLLEELRSEHRALEARLLELDNHLSLTPEEQVERARIKKLKLAKKDQIASLSRHFH